MLSLERILIRIPCMNTITDDLIIANVLEEWPEVIPVFLNYKMGCVGCAMAPFESLGDAIRIYKIPHNQFMDDLNSSTGNPNGVDTI